MLSRVPPGRLKFALCTPSFAWQCDPFLHNAVAGVPSNLLIQFRDDNIDQTQELVATLESASIAMSNSNSSKSQLTVRQLPGDHVRPLRQAFGDLPTDLAEVANQAVTQGSYFLQGLSNMATQAGFREVGHLLCRALLLLFDWPPGWGTGDIQSEHEVCVLNIHLCPLTKLVPSEPFLTKRLGGLLCSTLLLA